MPVGLTNELHNKIGSLQFEYYITGRIPGNFPEAIRIYNCCNESLKGKLSRKVAAIIGCFITLDHNMIANEILGMAGIAALSNLRNRLKTKNQKIKKRLDHTLVGLCSKFDVDTLRKIVQAYVLIGDADTLGKDLHAICSYPAARQHGRQSSIHIRCRSNCETTVPGKR